MCLRGYSGVSSVFCLFRIPDPLEMKGTSEPEGVAVDAKGNVYGGEVGPEAAGEAHEGGLNAVVNTGESR